MAKRKIGRRAKKEEKKEEGRRGKERELLVLELLLQHVPRVSDSAAG